MRDVQSVAGDEEHWRTIVGWPDYAVSDLGRIKRLTTRTFAKAGHILRTPARGGRSAGGRYLVVDLCRESIGKRTQAVHRLVAEAFIGPAGSLEVNHINGVFTDNRVKNLEYVTRSGNALHAYSLGLQDARGEMNGQAKLSEQDVIAIRTASTGRRGEQTAFAAAYSVNPSTIRDILARRTWPHI